MFMTLAALLAVQSNWDDPNPTGRWAQPTEQLAAELLPPDWAADAASHTVQYLLGDKHYPMAVRFEGRPVRTGDGFCARKTYYVSIQGAFPDGNEGKPQKPIAGDKLRLGNCDGIFAHINPGATLEDGKRALRWLEWAQKIAAGDGPMLVALTCRDEPGHGKCADGARAELARLPLAKTSIITRDFYHRPHQWEISVVETAPGQLYWETKINATPGATSIDMTWKIPAPF